LLFIVVYSFLQERRHAFYVEKKLARNLCGLAGPVASATCQQNLLIYSLSFYTLRDEESTRATLKLNPNRRLWARTTPCGAGLPLTIRLTWRPRRQDKTAFCSAGCAHCHTRPRRQRAGFFMNSSASDVDVSTPLTRSRHERSKRDCARHPGLDQHFKNLRGIGRFFFRKSADSTGSNFVIWSFLLNTNRSKSDSTLLEFFSPVVSLTLLRTACFVTQIASPPVGSARTASSGFALSTRHRTMKSRSRVGVWQRPAGFPANLCVTPTRIQPPTWKNCSGLKVLSVALVGGLKNDVLECLLASQLSWSLYLVCY
jgi:hypothetical protein